MLNIAVVMGWVGGPVRLGRTARGQLFAVTAFCFERRRGEDRVTCWTTLVLVGSDAEQAASQVARGSRLTVSGQFDVVPVQDDKSGVYYQRTALIAADVVFESDPLGAATDLPALPSEMAEVSIEELALLL